MINYESVDKSKYNDYIEFFNDEIINFYEDYLSDEYPEAYSFIDDLSYNVFKKTSFKHFWEYSINSFYKEGLPLLKEYIKYAKEYIDQLYKEIQNEDMEDYEWEDIENDEIFKYILDAITNKNWKDFRSLGNILNDLENQCDDILRDSNTFIYKFKKDLIEVIFK
jgi:hypothetical protein